MSSQANIPFFARIGEFDFETNRWECQGDVESVAEWEERMERELNVFAGIEPCVLELV